MTRRVQGTSTLAHVDTSYRGRLQAWWAGGCVIALAAALGTWLGWPRGVEVGHGLPHASAAGGSVVHSAAAARPVRLEITSRPAGAEIFLDGVYVGRTPAQRVPARPDANGQIELELRHRTLDAPLTRTLQLAPGAERGRVELDLVSPRD